MASQVRRTLRLGGASWRNPAAAAAAVAAGALVLSGCAAPGEGPSTMTETPPPPPVWTGEPAPVDHQEDDEMHAEDAAGQTLEAQLALADGTEIGTVTITESGDHLRIRTLIDADPSDVPPGFKGFHIHETGVCEANGDNGAFTSAGSHLNLDGEDHADHSGDLTSILILDDGTGELVTTTDRVTVDDLLSGDGAAFILHAGPDNFANIPDRYELADGGAVPDEQTLSTGDSGDRLACGVIEERS